MKKKVLILLGPTGVGKTEVSILLAKKFDFEIISADSVQVFKHFDIGSAKIKENEKFGVVHYGIDIKDPLEEFSVNDFVNYTKNQIEIILNKKKIPLIVGGTGLYIKSLVEGFDFGGTKRHEDFRSEMEKIAEIDGLERLYEMMKTLNPEIAQRVDKKNKVRLIRALEIAKYGKESSETAPNNYDFKVIALTLPREILYQNINKRCQKMIKDGLIDEVEKLYKIYGDCQPMRAIGYKETISYLNGQLSEEALLTLISQHTRNYAKRQITFMKNMNYIEYFDKTDNDFLIKIEEDIANWLLH